MTLRTIFITVAITSVALLGTIGSASAACACKTKFERNKPHVNVGTIGHVSHKKSSGQTAVIGGFGQNWRQAAPSAQQQELLIFVTPHIVRSAN